MEPEAGAIHPIKLNNVGPQAWLADVLARLPDYPANKIANLLPWNWQAARLAVAA
jgi:transposase